MSTYRKEWDCCGDVTETDAWEPETCPFCTASPAAAVPDGALLELPTSQIYVRVWESMKEPGESLQLASQPYFTSEQMQAYARAAVEADRAHRSENTPQQEGCDSALRAEPAWRKTQTPCSVCEGQNYQCHHCDGMGIEPRKIDHYGDCRCALPQYCDGKCNPVFADELATRCRAEGGDGAVTNYGSLVDNSADRAQQGEPVAWACALNLDHTPMETPDVEWGAECTWAPEFKPFPLYRAATKAAAAADAPTEHSRFGSPAMQALILANLAAPAPDTGIPTAGEVEKAGWISVEDELPEPGERVLVTRFAGRVGNAEHPGHPGVPWVEVTRYMVNCSMFECDLLSTGNVTHWMRIAAAPQPPEAKAGEDA